MRYVIAQFSLLFILLWPSTSLHFSSIGLTLILLSSLIACSALYVNRLGNFNIRPVPKVAGKLITKGVYRYIRHPMYSSLFFFGAGIIFFQPVLWKLIAWILLVLVLILKGRFEERTLVKHYSGYRDYQKKSSAFIPFIW